MLFLDSLGFILIFITTISNTETPLSFSDLVSKAVHLYGPPVSNSSQFNRQYQLFPCLNFTCRGKIQKLWFVARRQSQFPGTRLPTFHILRRYQGPEYCINTDPSDSDCEYYLWLRLNWNSQQPLLVYGNDTVGVYETTLTVNNSFETGDILGVLHPINTSLQVLYQREGQYCDTLREITIHLFGGHFQIPYLHQDPVLPYIAIETDASSQHCAMGFLKKESLQVIVDAPRDNRIYNSFDFRQTNIIQTMAINKSGLLVKFFIAAQFDHTMSSGWPVLQIKRRIHANDSSYFSQVFSTTMEPRFTGYLNVFEYDVQNMQFDIQHNDSIRVYWPTDTDVGLRRYCLAYFRDSSNVMLSIEIDKNESKTLDDSTIVATDTPGPMITGESDTHIITTIISAQIEHSGNKIIIVIGCLITIVLALILFLIVTIIIVLTYRYHKSKTAPSDANQQASTSKDFDIDSNQASTTQEEAKRDEAVDCIEMDANQAYITHSETKDEQGANKKEMDVANQAFATGTFPTDPNVAYSTVDCVEVDANPAYGTNTVPTDPNVAYGTHPPQIHDYDYVALP